MAKAEACFAACHLCGEPVKYSGRKVCWTCHAQIGRLGASTVEQLKTLLREHRLMVRRVEATIGDKL